MSKTLVIPEVRIRVQVDVTEDDIQMGTPCSAEYCPIARAAKRAIRTRFPFLELDHVTPVIVSSESIFVALANGGTETTWLPPEGKKFVRRFDDRLAKSEPTSFAVELLVKNLRWPQERARHVAETDSVS